MSNTPTDAAQARSELIKAACSCDVMIGRTCDIHRLVDRALAAAREDGVTTTLQQVFKVLGPGPEGDRLAKRLQDEYGPFDAQVRRLAGGSNG